MKIIKNSETVLELWEKNELISKCIHKNKSIWFHLPPDWPQSEIFKYFAVFWIDPFVHMYVWVCVQEKMDSRLLRKL